MSKDAMNNLKFTVWPQWFVKVYTRSGQKKKKLVVIMCFIYLEHGDVVCVDVTNDVCPNRVVECPNIDS